MIPSSSSSCSIVFLPRRAGEQRGLVDEVREVGAREAGRAGGERVEVDLRGERLALRVHLEDLAAAVAVGPVDDDLAVEAARAQQRRVEDVGPVRGRDQDDVVLQLEPVHLDEELVQRLLALVVAAAEAGAAVAADGVDLVHEDDARRRLLGLLEEVAHARRADADEHLDEVGARDREERHARLAGDRAREQRLTGAGRPVEQHALRDPRAERLELLRVLEELLDLLELLDRLVHAGDVLEADLRRVRRHPLGAALAEAHHLRAAALHLVHQEDPEAEQQDERQQRGEDRPPRRRAACPSSRSRRRSSRAGSGAAICDCVARIVDRCSSSPSGSSTLSCCLFGLKTSFLIDSGSVSTCCDQLRVGDLLLVLVVRRISVWLAR